MQPEALSRVPISWSEWERTSLSLFLLLSNLLLSLFFRGFDQQLQLKNKKEKRVYIREENLDSCRLNPGLGASLGQSSQVETREVNGDGGISRHPRIIRKGASVSIERYSWCAQFNRCLYYSNFYYPDIVERSVIRFLLFCLFRDPLLHSSGNMLVLNVDQCSLM